MVLVFEGSCQLLSQGQAPVRFVTFRLESFLCRVLSALCNGLPVWDGGKV